MAHVAGKGSVELLELIKELQQTGLGLKFYSDQLQLVLAHVCPHFISCLVHFLQLKTDPFLHGSRWAASGAHLSHLCFSSTSHFSSKLVSGG